MGYGGNSRRSQIVIPRLWSRYCGVPLPWWQAPSQKAKDLGAGPVRTRGKHYVLVNALVFPRPPNLPLMAMGMGCRLEGA